MKASATYLALLLVACGGEEAPSAPVNETPVTPGDPRFVRDPSLDVENVSQADEARSHNMGLNCLGCHQVYGPGRGRFTIGGTAHDVDGTPLVSPIVELRTKGPFEGGGELITTLYGDQNGNFFSTEPLPFPEAVFPVVYSADRSKKNAMPFPTSSGACNHCHTGGFKVRVALP